MNRCFLNEPLNVYILKCVLGGRKKDGAFDQILKSFSDPKKVMLALT